MLHDAPLLRSENEKVVEEICNDAFSQYEPKNRPNYCFTDISCKISRFIKGKEDLEHRWVNTLWVLDRYHGGRKHNMRNPDSPLIQHCLKHCDITKMDKQYLKTHFSGLSEGEGNSMAAEQIMNKFDGFTHAIQSMDYITMRFFLFWLCVDMNELLATKNPTKTYPTSRLFY